MNEKVFQYFHDEVAFTGVHSRYLDELWEQNQIKNSFVRTLYELYALAAIIGLRMKCPIEADLSEGKRVIQLKQIMEYTPILKTIMTTVLLLDETIKLNDEERIDRAFRGPETKEEFDKNVEIFNSYVRGGIEILYNELILRVLDVEDDYTDAKIGNIIAMLNNPFIKEI